MQAPILKANIPPRLIPPLPAAAPPLRVEDDFLSPLRGKRVRLVSLFGASVTGELVGIAKYEVKVRQPEAGDIVILKAGLWTVEELKS